MTALRRIVERHLRAFNERDVGAWTELLDEDVEITVDSESLRGVAAARAYAQDVERTYRGIRAELDRVVSESADTIVVEYRLINPAGDQSTGRWHLAGLVCEIIRVRDGRIVALRSYYAPNGADRTDAVHVPSRAEAARIAGEQAALRRVATLVARGVSQETLFAAVNEEVARLVGADLMALLRFEPDDTITLVAARSAEDVSFPLGAARPVDGRVRSARASGRSVRFGPATLPPSGPFAEDARRLGIRSCVSVPITVDGGVWGLSLAASARPEPFPDDTEARMAGFTELVATAIGNAQARSELRSLVEEQRALRRVATLVARGASPPEVFHKVAIEASRLLGDHATAVLRYEPSGDATVVAVHGSPATVGMRVPAEGNGIVARVLRSGRAARIDDHAGLRGPAGSIALELGLGAAVGAPIVAAGRPWGLIGATTPGGTLPAATEDRLAPFAELVAMAIDNAESRAELTASRARIVAAADDARRRIQRDLHDGAQQRLVTTIVTLNLVKQALGGAGGPEAELVDEALQNAQHAATELRELVHGIMPAALARGGLRSGILSLAGHMDLPVGVDVTADRLPASVETTAYFVVAEALNNAVKHAGAASAHVRAVVAGGALELELRDDGAGGADPTRGTGLVGLTDRVAASGGSIAIVSPQGVGTTLAVKLPLEQPEPPK